MSDKARKVEDRDLEFGTVTQWRDYFLPDLLRREENRRVDTVADGKELADKAIDRAIENLVRKR